MSKSAPGPREIVLRQMREQKYERLHKTKAKKPPAKVSAKKPAS